jgi:hypothetical protein
MPPSSLYLSEEAKEEVKRDHERKLDAIRRVGFAMRS